MPANLRTSLLPSVLQVVSGNIPSGLNLRNFAGGGIIPGALEALQRAIHGPENYQKVREILSPVTKSRSGYPFDHQAIANEMSVNAEKAPTTILSRDGVPKAAYQLESRLDGTMLSYLLGMQKGAGASALEDAYHAAAKKPVYLHAVPGSEGFYRKQKAWTEVDDDGIPKFIRKAHGGLIRG